MIASSFSSSSPFLPFSLISILCSQSTTTTPQSSPVGADDERGYARNLDGNDILDLTHNNDGFDFDGNAREDRNNGNNDPYLTHNNDEGDGREYNGTNDGSTDPVVSNNNGVDSECDDDSYWDLVLNGTSFESPFMNPGSTGEEDSELYDSNQVC